MARKLLEDKEGKLSTSGANVVLTDSRITLGGQQYTNASLTVALPSMTASSLYFVYAKIVSGNAGLEISTDIPSVYQAGIERKTRLVGAFYAESSSVVGGFVNINESPETDWLNYIPIGSWGNTTYRGRWRRVGSALEAYIGAKLTNSPSGGNPSLTINLPPGLTIDTSILTSSYPDANSPNDRICRNLGLRWH